MTPTDEWKPIPGFPGYFMNREGKVKRESRVVTEKGGKTRVSKEKVISHCKGKFRNSLNLFNEEGHGCLVGVAPIMLKLFGDPSRVRSSFQKLYCCHLDLDKWNDELSNLAWKTRTEITQMVNARRKEMQNG